MSKKASLSDVPAPGFTGVARSMVCFHNQGHNNFKVVTLTIENGIVVKQELSDPYCQVEALHKFEYANEMSVYSLNNKWEDGKALFK